MVLAADSLGWHFPLAFVSQVMSTHRENGVCVTGTGRHFVSEVGMRELAVYHRRDGDCIKRRRTTCSSRDSIWPRLSSLPVCTEYT